MTTTVTLDAVTRRFVDGTGHRTALDSVSFTAEAGELVLVMGPSGCGKSTLLGIAGGIEQPDAGTVRLGGKQLAYGGAARARRLRDDVGFVFQERNLLADLTAIENVALPLELAGVPTSQARSAALDALRAVGIADRAETYPSRLSGGEEQRVAVARALIGSRQLLLADEPTAALDTLGAQGVMALIRARCDAGATAIVATHDSTLAAFADRVVFLRDGAVVGSTRGATS
jgi:putative ABC transport system ATP-binding protein